MDTNLGILSLTENQKKNYPFRPLLPDPFKGFSIWGDGKVVGVSEIEPSQQQISDAIDWFNAIPEDICEGYYVSVFNTDIAIAREAQVFDAAALMRLMPVSYTINELIRFKNFWGGMANGQPYSGLKQMLAGLVTTGAITQNDSDKLSGILLEQGINLAAH